VQVGVSHERAIPLAAQDKPLAPRNDEQAAVWQPVDAKWKTKGNSDCDFALATGIDGKNLLRAPVREPKTVLVPACDSPMAMPVMRIFA
jgi:hypothetical protein